MRRSSSVILVAFCIISSVGRKYPTISSSASEREEKLSRREGDLSTYVSQAQDELERREQEWWAKQLGTPLQGDRSGAGQQAVA